MAFQEGNQWWKLRSKHGRDKLFASPELLLESAFEYFQWCDENPWKNEKETSSPNGTTYESKPTQRPYSLAGWFLYIGCSDTWLKEFKKKASDDFLRVINEVELIIQKQQWEGATVGAFKENIIARTLGLKDSNDITTNGKDLNLNPLTQDELKKASDSLDDV